MPVAGKSTKSTTAETQYAHTSESSTAGNQRHSCTSCVVDGADLLGAGGIVVCQLGAGCIDAPLIMPVG